MKKTLSWIRDHQPKKTWQRMIVAVVACTVLCTLAGLLGTWTDNTLYGVGMFWAGCIYYGVLRWALNALRESKSVVVAAADPNLPHIKYSQDLKGIRNVIADEIAAVYGNAASDAHEEHANRVMEVIRPYLEKAERGVIADPVFVQKLVEARNTVLEEYTRCTKEGRPATAGVYWNAVQDYNREIIRALRGEGDSGG